MLSDPVTLAKRWFQEIWNEGHLETADELMGKGCILHQVAVSGEINEPSAFKALVQSFREAFPDIRIDIVDALSEGTKSVVRCVVTGTHTGDGLGVPPSQKPIQITGMALGDWRDGKLVEGWNNFDMLSLYEQIDLFKRPLPAA